MNGINDCSVVCMAQWTTNGKRQKDRKEMAVHRVTKLAL